MEVGVTELRAELKRWLKEVEAGGEIVITDRGRPVARLSPAGAPTTLERLEREGVIVPPRSARRRRASETEAVEAKGNVSDYVSAQRD